MKRSQTPRCVDHEIEDYRKRVDEVNTPPNDLKPLYRLHCDSHVIGLLKEEIVKHLAAFPKVFIIDDGTKDVAIHPQHSTREQREHAMTEVTSSLRDKKVINGWRNELYPAVRSYGDEPFFGIERAAVLTFGIKGYGVHVNGYVVKSDGMYMWVGKRSTSKQTWSGRLDHVVAGGQPMGIGLMENVVKECQEEAGIPSELAKTARPGGAVSYINIQPDGVKSDVLFVYDLLLPEDFVPTPVDGEVESFSLRPISEIKEIIRGGTAYKPNCVIVIIDFFIRHGLISPDQNGYLKLLAALRRGSFS